MRNALLAAFLLSVAAAPAFAFQCPADMARIDEALAANPQLSEDQLAQVQSLRAEGEALHDAGDHQGSVDKLQEALAILGAE